MITNYPPVHFDLDFSTWNQKAVVELVRNEFDIEIAIRTNGDCLKR
jgi:hypothetical protein